MEAAKQEQKDDKDISITDIDNFVLKNTEHKMTRQKN